MTIGQTSPIDPLERFLEPTKDLQRRVADLERALARSSITVTFRSGTGSPAGVLAAPVGSIWLRTDGGTTTTLYVKETGGSTSSGWVAK